MAEPVFLSRNFVVTLDYGQFALRTGDTDGDAELALLDEALTGAGIAQRDDLVIVLSPHQNNFEMPLAVEIWNKPAPDDLADWQEAFEVHLEVGLKGVRFDSPTLMSTDLAVPPGSYHALITGRGFVRVGWPDSTTPGDSWRIRLWPSDGPARPARLSRYEESEATG